MKPFLNTIGKDAMVTDNKIYVAIVFSQSNMDGRIMASTLPPDIPNPSLRVNVFKDSFPAKWDYTISPATDGVNTKYATDTIVFNRLAEYLNRDIWVAKKSRGGTGLFMEAEANWNLATPDGNSLYFILRNRVIATRDYINITLQKECVFTFIWADIGEHDQPKLEFKADGAQAYKDLFADLRLIAGNPTLPIIHREIPLLKSDGADQWFNDMQKSFEAGEIANYTLLRRTPPYPTFDGVHIGEEGALQYADDMLELIKPFYPNPI